jgi:hypothetical protein
VKQNPATGTGLGRWKERLFLEDEEFVADEIPDEGKSGCEELGDHHPVGFGDAENRLSKGRDYIDHTTVDADAGMLLRHKAKLRAEAKRREDEDIARRQKLANVRREAEHNRPVSGKRMIVFKGRKVPLGTTGLVFWVRDGRVGLRTSDRKDNSGKWADIVWVNESNLKNVEPFV